MSNPVYWKNKKHFINLSSAENAQSVVQVNSLPDLYENFDSSIYNPFVCLKLLNVWQTEYALSSALSSHNATQRTMSTRPVSLERPLVKNRYWCYWGNVGISSILMLSVSSSSWCLETAAVCDCGTPWTFLLPFFFARHPSR